MNGTERWVLVPLALAFNSGCLRLGDSGDPKIDTLIPLETPNPIASSLIKPLKPDLKISVETHPKPDHLIPLDTLNPIA